MAWLAAIAAMLDGGDIREPLAQSPLGLDEGKLMRLTGRPLDYLRPPDDALWLGPRADMGPRTLILRAYWKAARDAVVAALARLHQDAPDEPGAHSARLRRLALPALPDTPWQALINDLLRNGAIVRNGPWLHLAGHAVRLDDEEAGLAQRLLPLLHAGAYDPPWVRDLARGQNLPEERVRKILRKLVRRGDVAQIVPDLLYHRERIEELAALIAKLAGGSGSGAGAATGTTAGGGPDASGAAAAAKATGVNAASFRDVTGLGRKRAVQILEFFDRVGYTRRLRDVHVLRTDGGARLFDRQSE
jgi:selenocysteine-specific elongation factor